MDYIYQIFGSKTSVDVDIMVFVDEINHDDLELSTKRCAEFNEILSSKYPGQELNCNLGVIKDGILVDVYKGMWDECHNSLSLTYKNFDQPYPLQLTGLVERDVFWKLLRGYRILMSFLSRTQHRMAVKAAIRGTLEDKIKALELFDFSTELNLGKRNVTQADFYKIMVFQILQVYGLMIGVEYYDKEKMWTDYPELKGFLNRDPNNYDYSALVQVLEVMIIVTRQLYNDKMDWNEDVFLKQYKHPYL